MRVALVHNGRGKSSILPTNHSEVTMARNNFQYEKRQRELEKKRKADEKAKRKQEAKSEGEPAADGETSAEADADADAAPGGAEREDSAAAPPSIA